MCVSGSADKASVCFIPAFVFESDSSPGCLTPIIPIVVVSERVESNEKHVAAETVADTSVLVLLLLFLICTDYDDGIFLIMDTVPGSLHCVWQSSDRISCSDDVLAHFSDFDHLMLIDADS